MALVIGEKYENHTSENKLVSKNTHLSSIQGGRRGHVCIFLANLHFLCAYLVRERYNFPFYIWALLYKCMRYVYEKYYKFPLLSFWCIDIMYEQLYQLPFNANFSAILTLWEFLGIMLLKISYIPLSKHTIIFLVSYSSQFSFIVPLHTLCSAVCCHLSDSIDKFPQKSSRDNLLKKMCQVIDVAMASMRMIWSE